MGPSPPPASTSTRWAPSQVEICLSHPNVKMIVNALGPPPQYVVDRAHECGLLVGGLAGSRAARRAPGRHRRRRDRRPGHRGGRPLRRDLDHGAGARGRRRGRRPTCRCWPPGGIATGRQMAAALALGRPGRVDRLDVAHRRPRPTPTRRSLENLLAATSRDTVRSRAMTGKPARQLRTAWTDAWEGPDVARHPADAAAGHPAPGGRSPHPAGPRQGAHRVPGRSDRRAA